MSLSPRFVFASSRNNAATKSGRTEVILTLQRQMLRRLARALQMEMMRKDSLTLQKHKKTRPQFAFDLR